jgi:hypothetical protein
MSIVIDGTGTISGVSATGLSAVQNLPASAIIQTVQADSTTYFQTTSTLQASGVTATITPKFATSKILILITMNGVQVQGSTKACHMELYKNGGSIQYMEDFLGYNNANAIGVSGSYQFLDSPATTSATTYAMYIGPSTAGTNITLNNYVSAPNRTRSSITLLEIAQ